MPGYIYFLIIAFVIHLDARTLRQEAGGLYADVVRWSPRTWTILALLVSPIAVPWYYYRRHKFLRYLRTAARESLPVGADVPAAEPPFPELTSSESLLIDGRPPEEEPYSPEPNSHFARITETTGVALGWFLWLILLLLLYPLVGLVFPVQNARLLELAVLAELSSIVMVCLIYGAIKKHRGSGFWKSLCVEKGESFVVKSLLVPGAVGLILAGASFGILTYRGAESSSPLSQALGEGSPLALFAFLGMAVLTAPLLEELIFRGYFYSAIERVKGKSLALWSITLLFALFHVEQLWTDWLGILVIGVLAFCLTFMRAWSGSTVPGIVVHYVYNCCLAVILPILALYLASPAYFEFTLKSAQLDTVAKERLLEESITTHPEFTPAYNALAWMYAEQGTHLDEALYLIETALDSEPDNHMYLDTLAEVLYRLGRYDEAIEIESELVDHHPNVSFYQKQLKKYLTAKETESVP